MDDLAIVVPAYRARYLAQTMRSLLNQTKNCFKIYVFDDASPDNIKDLVDPLLDGQPVEYFRFDQNLGGHSLAEHWNRCVERVNARYIWIVSDDDLVESNCVEAFFENLKKSARAADVYRFNTIIIDRFGQIESISPPHPKLETPIEFIYHRMLGRRDSCVSNYVFSRGAFLKSKGFINFPLAWYSDDASWVQFAAQSHIETIEGPRVYYRANSGVNISSAKSCLRGKKLDALIKYLLFLEQNYSKDNSLNSSIIDWRMLRSCIPNWIYKNIIFLGGVPLINVPKLAGKLRPFMDDSYTKITLRLFYCSLISMLYRSFNRIKVPPVKIPNRESEHLQ